MAFGVSFVDEQSSSAAVKHGANLLTLELTSDAEVIGAWAGFADAACGYRVVHCW